MNILLVCTIRCGGTYLSNYLSEKYNLKLYTEPSFLPKSLNDICVKLIVWEHTLEEILDYCKKFDYIILLDRKNIEEQTESFLALAEQTHKPYDSWIWEEKYKSMGKGYDYYEDILMNSKKDIEYISDTIGKNIYYYENIYYNNQPIYDLDFQPDLTKKLRKQSITKTPI